MIEAYLTSYGPSVIGGAVFLGVAWLVAIWIDRSSRYIFVKRLKLDAAVGIVLSRTIRIAILVLAAIVVLDELGIEIASLIAALGIFGFAIAIGLRTTSTNFFSGVMILILKPYKIGDYIEGERVEGAIEAISVFHTVLVSPEGVYIAVPNGAMWARSVKNFSRPRPRRLELDITLARGKPYEEYSAVIDGCLRAETALYPEFPPLVRVETVSDKELKLLAAIWCDAALASDLTVRLSQDLQRALIAAGVEVVLIEATKKTRIKRAKAPAAAVDAED